MDSSSWCCCLAGCLDPQCKSHTRAVEWCASVEGQAYPTGRNVLNAGNKVGESQVRTESVHKRQGMDCIYLPVGVQVGVVPLWARKAVCCQLELWERGLLWQHAATPLDANGGHVGLVHLLKVGKEVRAFVRP